jgi:hypothetical protein
MNSNCIIEYIKVKYPHIIANGDFFCILKNNSIIGFCDCTKMDNQKILSLTKPINVNQNLPIMKFLYNTVENLPMVKLQKQRERILIKNIKNILKKNQIYTYNAFYDNEMDDFIFIKSEYEKYINDIKKQMQLDQKMIEICKKEIMYNINPLLKNIQIYKNGVVNYFSSIDDLDMKITKKFYKKNKNNCNFLIRNLDLLCNSQQSIPKESNLLLDNIIILKNEFEELKRFFNKDKLYIILLNGYKDRSKKYILGNKDNIIKSIREYYTKWYDLYDTQNDLQSIHYYKTQVIKNILLIENLLKDIVEKHETINSKILNRNIIHIYSALKHLLNDQLINLSFKGNVIINQSKTESNSSSDEIIQNIDNSEKNIKYRLKRIRDLLYLNNKTLVNKDNSNVKNELVYNFITLNNIFFRKQRVVKELNDIIQNENIFIEDYILIHFEKIKNNIDKHVAFLNLQEIINSIYFKYYKIKSTRNKIPESFYTNITNILHFWNYNILYYLNQDLSLANIIDDLIKDVKVYIRIKPLVGIKDNYIKSNENSISLNEKTYNGFENIYPDNFTNLDVYIGKQDFDNVYSLDNINFLEKFKMVPNGFYNAFNKLQTGYSVFLYGNGISGSGTSYTLFGEKGIPGIVQYGLANLQNVSSIKLKNLFEQYVYSTNDTSIKGNIHNLINLVPQLNEYFSIDETTQFSEIIPSYINLKSLELRELDDLLEIIETHRTKMNRIKYLPTNVGNGSEKSSRSTLYYIFEINFNNGDKTLFTVVDSCSQDTPRDVYNLFIDSNNMKLENFMICNKDEGIEFVKKHVKNNIKEDYTPDFIYQCLQESIYNNETNNHFNYYMNSKNNYYDKINYHKIDEYEYDKSMFFVNPKFEYKKINRNNNCLTIPILQFIENMALNLIIKQLKYYLIYNIRNELSKYTQTIQTLNLSENINSKKLLGTLPILITSPEPEHSEQIFDSQKHSKHSDDSQKYSQKVIKIIIQKEI